MVKTILTTLALSLGATIPATASRPTPEKPQAPNYHVVSTKGADLKSIRHAKRIPAESAQSEIIEPVRVPLRAPQSEEGENNFHFYGPLDYSDNWSVMTDGMYRLTPDAQPELSFPFEGMGWTYDTVDLAWGWIENNMLHAANIVTAMNKIYVYEMYTIDLSTKTVVAMDDILPHLVADWMHPFMEVAAYNPSDGYLYGYGSNADGTGHAFTRANAEDVAEAEVIKELDWTESPERCFSLCFDTESNCLYGVNNSGNLVKIDLQGNQTLLGKTPLKHRIYKSTSGMTIDHDANCLYMNLVNNNDYSSALYRYDLSTGEFEQVLQFDYCNSFKCFFNTSDLDNPNLPERPMLVSDTFTDASLSGSLTFKMPSSWADGKPMEGDLKLTVSVDGTEILSEEHAVGSNVKINIDLSQGEHTIKAYTTKDGKSSRPVFKSRWFGNDVPCAPELIDYSNDIISWKPVTKGIHGGYVDTSALKYNVYLNGESVEGSPTTSTHLNASIPEGRPYTAYIFEIVAECNGMLSESTKTEPVCTGEPLTTDVFFAPTINEALAFTMLSIGEYYPDWKIDTDDNGVIWFNSDIDNWEPMGNMLVTPPIKFDDTNHYYSFSTIAAIANSWGDKDKFEVYIGKEPTFEDLDTQIMGTTKPTKLWSEDGTEFSNIFTVPEPGVYYIGIKCVSDISQAGVMVRNISITKSEQTLGGPATVEDMKAVAAEKGGLTADVTFSFPRKRANGMEYEASTQLSATISCVNSETVTGAPGETKTVTVITEQGDNTIEAYCSLDGEKSTVSTINVYTGVDIPKAITDLKVKVTEDGKGVELSWTPPTEGIDGGYIDPSALSYRINCMQYYEYVNEAVDHYTYYLPEDAPQGFYGLWVDPCSAAGRPNEFFASERVLIGAPYSIPATENFTGNELEYTPVMAYTGAWYINNPTKIVTNTDCEDNAALILLADNGPGEARLPMFCTLGDGTPVFTANIFNHPSLTPTATLSAMTYGMEEPELIGTFSKSGSGWTACSIALPEKFRNRPWVSFYLNVDINEGQAWLLDSYSVSTDVSVKGVEGTHFSIRTVTGGVELTGADGEIRVYRIDGSGAAVATGNGTTVRISLEPGVYIVTANGTTHKAYVRK